MDKMQKHSFYKVVRTFEKIFEEIKIKTGLNIKLNFEDRSFNDILEVEYISSDNRLGFAIHFEKFISYHVFDLKHYFATREEPEDFVEENEKEFDNNVEAIKEIIKRYYDNTIEDIFSFNYDSI